MTLNPPVTRLAGLSRPAAIAVLIGMLVAALVFGAIALRYHEPPVDLNRGSDRAMYERVIGRLRAGENYYDAARTELSQGGYGMKSVFNWRPPLFAEALALFPSLAIPQAMVWALGIVAGIAACLLLLSELGPIAAGFGIVSAILSLGVCAVPQAFLLSEIPVGALMLVSASAYGLGCRRTGQGLGVAALFIRELAGPYVLILAFLAWREKRYRELAAWGLALAAYAVYFGWHAYMVHLHQQPGDHGDAAGWMQFGGAQFVLLTAQFNGVFLGLPLWISAAVLIAAFVGLAAWPGPAGTLFALTVYVYLALFALIGKPVDTYWGALFTPMMTLGLFWFPAALRDLCRRLGTPETGLQRA